jgi:exosortase
MAGRWVEDPEYSHGFLVPLFAAALLYVRRDRLAAARLHLDGRGLPLLAVGAAGYVAGAYVYFDWLSAVALIPTLAGLVLLLGGGPGLRWAGPAVAFLVFMVPLPYRVETALGVPLQGVATKASTWVLQAVGFPAVAEGHTIVLEHGRVAVVEACNGLSMMLAFAAITTGMALVVRRPLLDKLVVVASTVPIAIGVNVVRIVLNGIALELWGVDVAHRVFHDLGGWLMMPLAVGLVWVELWVLSRLLVEVPEVRVSPLVGLPPAGRPAQRSAAHP